MHAPPRKRTRSTARIRSISSLLLQLQFSYRRTDAFLNAKPIEGTPSREDCHSSPLDGGHRGPRHCRGGVRYDAALGGGPGGAVEERPRGVRLVTGL